MSGPLEGHDRIAALLGGPLGWHTVRHEAEVTSTNDVVLDLLTAGVPPGVVVAADHQTAGRGRQGRPWDDASVQGAARSLTASFGVNVPDTDVTLVPLAAGLTVADALRRVGGSPMLKWPNDVLLPAEGGRLAKCAGILVERHALDSGEVLIIGTGIDLDWRDVPREDEAAEWTSVAESTGDAADRGDVLADLMRGLAVWLRSVPTDPLRLLVAYRDACATIGQPVRVTFPDGEHLEGIATDLDRQGRLVVETADGPVAITAGDVEHVRPS